MEIRLHTREAKLLKKNLGLVYGIVVDCDSIGNRRKGGLCLFWSNYLNIFVQSFLLHHIDVVVEKYG